MKPPTDKTTSTRAPRDPDSVRDTLLQTVAAIPAIVSVHEGPDHMYVYSNPANDTAVGHRPLLGRGLREAMPELEGQGIFERFDQVYGTGESSLVERLHVRVRTDGALRERCYLQMLQPWLGTDGRVRGVWSMAMDLSAQVHTEQAMLESSQRFATIFDHAPIGIGVLSADGQWLEVNDRLCKMLGYTREAVQQLSWLDITHPDDRAADIVQAQRLVDGEIDDYSMEKRYLRRNGSIQWTNLTMSMVDRTAPVKEVIGVVEDIDARKRAEREQHFLAEVGATLASSIDYEETLSSIARLAVSFLADCCVVDLVGDDQLFRWRVLHADPSKAQLASDLEGIPLHRDTPHLGGPVITTQQVQLVPDISSEDLEAMAQDPEHLRLLRELAPVSLMGLPLVAHGRTLGALVLISSTPGRRYGPEDLMLGKALASRAALAVDNARLYRAAQQAIRERDELMAVVAHDLRNPLSTVRLAAQIALERIREEDPSRPVRSSLEIIGRSVEHASQLIQDLLDTTRIDLGKLSMKLVPVAPGPLIAEAVSNLAPMAAQASLALESEVAEALPAVIADRHRMLQVFTNLIENAIKFTPPGGRIRVTAEQRGDEVCCSVADTGPGMPPEHLPRLFDRFWQAHRGDRRGAGLGLTIARGLVEHHGGRLWAESTLGQGSTFRFTLPVAGGPEDGSS